MVKPALPQDLIEPVSALAAAFASHPRVVSAKARIGLFYQNPSATELFRKVSELGDRLHARDAAGTQPSEAELAHFDEMRRTLLENPLCKDFLEARDDLDSMLITINRFLCMAMQKGSVPTLGEIEQALEHRETVCSCGGHCRDGCDGPCDGSCCDNEEGRPHSEGCRSKK